MAKSSSQMKRPAGRSSSSRSPASSNHSPRPRLRRGYPRSGSSFSALGLQLQMMTPNRLLRRLRSMFTTQQHDDEMDEELRFHIEMEAAKRVRAGMPEGEAYLSARRDLGNVPRHLDDARDARRSEEHTSELQS